MSADPSTVPGTALVEPTTAPEAPAFASGAEIPTQDPRLPDGRGVPSHRTGAHPVMRHPDPDAEPLCPFCERPGCDTRTCPYQPEDDAA